MLATQSQWKLTGLLLLVLAVGCDRAFSAGDTTSLGPRIVMIIRHAEKPEPTTGEKDPNLTEQGFARAEALAKVIPEHFPRPDFLIATKRSKGSNRPVETITPLSKALHEEIDATFADKEFERLAHVLLTDPKYAGKVVLIAWHHGKIPELAKALGAKDVPDKWGDSVFNRVWEIDYKKGVAAWKDLPENALPCDSEQAAETNAIAAQPQSKAAAEDAAQLKAAQEERIKVLTQLVDQVMQQYRVGTTVLAQLSSAEHELCKARLDATDDSEKRVAILTAQLHIAEDIVKVVQARHAAGTVTESDVLQAKSLHLDIKIKLLRERSRTKPPAPATGKQS